MSLSTCRLSIFLPTFGVGVWFSTWMSLSITVMISALMSIVIRSRNSLCKLWFSLSFCLIMAMAAWSQPDRNTHLCCYRHLVCGSRSLLFTGFFSSFIYSFLLPNEDEVSPGIYKTKKKEKREQRTLRNDQAHTHTSSWFFLPLPHLQSRRVLILDVIKTFSSRHSSYIHPDAIVRITIGRMEIKDG